MAEERLPADDALSARDVVARALLVVGLLAAALAALLAAPLA